ncbi:MULTISPECIES: electron transfer flavoprotein subunit alpha/FixB family protein [Cytobacillus]|jgi:electron transfer flavoprotein alpha subunit|uniref:electron transfer flavoprotein subunit alpha/FixB family protein n=2 Tax=Bacillaceae TaxID=186817 RepID=UPI00203D9D50|nr:electron transfer flavoprotein subunit alpha/FixB family protein [Cytobacillus oceanisediminis]MBY0157649.1 electron transfer flavoprotein subunit alpha/FixB family protein [Cytobacillus firmus]MCM3241613.1 electron transfer flavoprotein subunit alpha/FixB family protein [Cytobacillus oceanisediminis]MCM3396002.1 electron transfer flavoprotein subunit alpha/FixB family protein [Cytobacillus oceanisediminis]MCM3405986.1 electron transfer flavoprotein subunit alpha/FixB family protein [Cytobac
MMDEYRGVWVFIEQNDGKIEGVSLELLGAGRKLADKLDVPLSGVLLGYEIKSLCQEVIAYGADQVYVIDHEVMKDYRTESYMKAVINLAEKYKPEIFLYGATSNGKDLASAVATDLSTGLTADTTMLDVEVDKRLLEASRPAFGGNIMATILCKKHRPQMATVRPKVMKALEPDPDRQGEVIEEAITLSEDDMRTKVIKIVKDVTKKVNLADAHVVVAGGKGMGDFQNFQLIHDLADAIGATVGGTRDVVEAGWLPHEQQVGQTGETITPKVYFAIGISGAIQHVVGMKNSEFIIAINKDPDAPIFDVATYGIVGDALEIVPKLIKELKEARERGGEMSYV